MGAVWSVAMVADSCCYWTGLVSEDDDGRRGSRRAKPEEQAGERACTATLPW